MSAFSQHDELHPIVERGECRFCDTPIEAFLEGDSLVPLYQILRERGAPFLVCDTCWYLAVRGAQINNVSAHAGVHTLYATRR